MSRAQKAKAKDRPVPTTQDQLLLGNINDTELEDIREAIKDVTQESGIPNNLLSSNFLAGADFDSKVRALKSVSRAIRCLQKPLKELSCKSCSENVVNFGALALNSLDMMRERLEATGTLDLQSLRAAFSAVFRALEHIVLEHFVRTASSVSSLRRYFFSMLLYAKQYGVLGPAISVLPTLELQQRLIQEALCIVPLVDRVVPKLRPTAVQGGVQEDEAKIHLGGFTAQIPAPALLVRHLITTMTENPYAACTVLAELSTYEKQLNQQTRNRDDKDIQTQWVLFWRIVFQAADVVPAKDALKDVDLGSRVAPLIVGWFRAHRPDIEEDVYFPAEVKARAEKEWAAKLKTK